ncbi:MAG: biotin--[acetyl-CoA-carboxylase] ligase, partial [Alphaproteobacteria bacterium]|nr:biotin--[acetyl-CoA-carboxylase] ligase [Alphaproteobacteria bacterium]
MIAPIPVLRYASIDSTNLEARRLAEQGEMGPIWLVADEQTAGRGRLGRQWHSEQGNLYSTLLFPVNASQAKAAQIAFIAALAVYDVATHFIKNPNISLKWPNDCLLDDAKFSGVLAEYIGGVPPMMALGIGMNIAHAPKGLPYPTTYLATHSPSVTVEAAHEVLSARLQNWLKIWNDAKNFAA